MLSKKISFKEIHSFEVKSSYMELDSHSPENVYDSHIHSECEIYINLSGDVSFVVENNIYPVTPYSIIITRPFEYHHCIYHSNKLHKHFRILFSAAGNEYLFDKFYNREIGKNNFLFLEKDKTGELISICEKITTGLESEFEKYLSFFTLINLIDDAGIFDRPTVPYPDIVINALSYINDNLLSPISVSEIAKKVNVSVNTLERYFMQFLDISPTVYIKKKRLSNAARLLSEGYNVTEAAAQSGFPDCSRFISLFRKTYGQTPNAYKKSLKIFK